MQELEKILEEIRKAFEENTEYIMGEDGEHRFVIDGCTATYLVNNIIRKHMNDGWIPVEERMPTQEECEDNWFWIAYGDSFGNSPRVARCEWVFADDENGNDASESEFYIDQFPLPYKPSKNLIKAWKIIDIPAPYRPKRNE